MKDMITKGCLLKCIVDCNVMGVHLGTTHRVQLVGDAVLENGYKKCTVVELEGYESLFFNVDNFELMSNTELSKPQAVNITPSDFSIGLSDVGVGVSSLSETIGKNIFVEHKVYVRSSEVSLFSLFSATDKMMLIDMGIKYIEPEEILRRMKNGEEPPRIINLKDFVLSKLSGEYRGSWLVKDVDNPIRRLPNSLEIFDKYNQLRSLAENKDKWATLMKLRNDDHAEVGCDETFEDLIKCGFIEQASDTTFKGTKLLKMLVMIDNIL